MLTFSPRVLIVEDQRQWQEVFREIIELATRAETFTVSSLREAIDALDKILFDLALLDYRLAEDDPYNRDGKIVAMRINDLQEGTRVIIVTAYGDVVDAEEAFRDFHAYDFIRKHKMDFLRDRIRSAIEQSMVAAIRSLQPEDFPDSLLRQGSLSELEGILGMKKKSRELKSCLARLFDGLYPILPSIAGAKVSPDSGVACARVWSRALGEPIEVRFGKQEKIASMIQQLDKSQALMRATGLEQKVSEVLDENCPWGAVVYISAEKAFEDFRSIPN
jgi:CheY-like chemotaxis protein